MATLQAPIQFPEDQYRCIPRRLEPISGQMGNQIDTNELVRRLARGKDWYAILSPEGSGKTSLLNEVTDRLEETDLVRVPPIALPRIEAEEEGARWEQAIDTLLIQVVQAVEAHLRRLGLSPEEGAEASRPREWFVRRLGEIAHWLEADQSARLLLSFDGFQNLAQPAAHAFASSLMDLHSEQNERITCIITSDDDLETLRKDYSPLRGRVIALTLLDFSSDDVDDLVRQVNPKTGLTLDRAAREALWEQTEGFPALCCALIDALAGQTVRGRAPVDQAVRERVANEAFPWMERSLDELYRQANTDLFYESALDHLLTLLEGGKLKAASPEAKVLTLKGFLRAEGPEAGWRNPVVRQYFLAHREAVKEKIERRSAMRRLLGRKLRARGTIHVSLVMNFRHFVIQQDKEKFDLLRGSASYEGSLQRFEKEFRNRKKFNHFSLDSEQDRLRQIAKDLNIFRQEAAQVAFPPIYILTAAQDPLLCNPSAGLSKRLFPNANGVLSVEQSRAYQDFVVKMREEWRNWEYKSVQITADGLIHVRLERSIEENQGELLTVMTNVLNLEKSPEGAAMEENRESEVSLQWEIAMALVRLFIEKTFPYEQANFVLFKNQEDPLRFSIEGQQGEPMRPGDPLYPLSERYVIYEFTKLCNCRADQQEHPHLIQWEDLVDPDRPETEDDKKSLYSQELAGLLEGAAVTGGSADEAHRFPEIKQREADARLQDDLSSWKGELCLLTLSNGILYYRNYDLGEKVEGESSQTGELCKRCKRKLQPAFGGVVFPQRGRVSYQEYWKCVLRGLEYIVNLRLQARLIASISTRYLIRLADLAEKNGSSGSETHAEIEELRRKVATNKRLLARLRDATIPIFIARTDYSARKYEAFIRLCRIEETIRNAESDFEGINAFLEHEDEKLARKREARISGLVSLAALVLSCVALPSFDADFTQSIFAKGITSYTPWLSLDVARSISIVIIVALITLFVLLVARDLSVVFKELFQKGPESTKEAARPASRGERNKGASKGAGTDETPAQAHTPPIKGVSAPRMITRGWDIRRRKNKK